MTIVTLRLRKDSRTGDDTQPLPTITRAFDEEVDLDALTPRARALAEAIHASPGHMPLDLTLRTDSPAAVSEEVAAAYGDRASRRTTVSRVGEPMRADSTETAQWWLEHHAHAMPLDWYVVGPVGGDPVPSMAAGATDRYLTRQTILDYLRRHDCPLSIQARDALSRTPLLAPDRHVCGQPQWRVETVDAYIGRPRELWPISQVADYLGYTGRSATGSARKQLHRWGLTPVGRGTGPTGESLYEVDQVKAVHTSSPGSGRRGAPRAGGRFTVTDAK